MNLYELIFGKQESFDENNDAPTYDSPLLRRDFSTAIPMLRVAIAKEDARAMGAYGALCASGHGVEKDMEEAYCWLLQAANRGDVPSQLALGMLLAGDVGVPTNRTEAAYWLYRASWAGNWRAIKALEALTEKDRSVVGRYFSEEELNRLLYSAMKNHLSTPSRTTTQERN